MLGSIIERKFSIKLDAAVRSTVGACNNITTRSCLASYERGTKVSARARSLHLPAAPAWWYRVWFWSRPRSAGCRPGDSADPVPSSPSAPAADCCWRCCWNRPSSPRSPTSCYAVSHAVPRYTAPRSLNTLVYGGVVPSFAKSRSERWLRGLHGE